MSDPRSHFCAAKDEMLGADAGSFMPYLGMISGLLGGGGDKAKSSEGEALKLAVAQQQQQIAAQQAAAKRTQTYVIAGVSIAAIGTVLYLALRR